MRNRDLERMHKLSRTRIFENASATRAWRASMLRTIACATHAQRFGKFDNAAECWMGGAC
jgi:hypothetical protein